MGREMPQKRSAARKKILDESARAYSRVAAKSFIKGHYTAKQTGARKMAEARKKFSGGG